MIFTARKRAFLKVLEHLQAGSLALTLPDGSVHHFKGTHPGPHADLIIHSPDALRRIISDGKMGFCEAFMRGEVSSTTLPGLIELAVIQNEYLDDRLQFHFLKNIFRKITHRMRANSRRGSRRNIASHYDLGNGFYAKWLDDSMTYSSAIYENDSADLLAAQQAKYRRLAELAGIKDGDKVLEIGCGWGGFAEYVGRHYDASVTAITISKEQYHFARERIAKAGLADRVEITLMDYRDLNMSYDKIISIEMFEAVGQAYWPLYFATLSKCLNAGGRAALQVITINDAMFESYRLEGDFIQHYIFPGGMLPSMEVLHGPMSRAGLKLAAVEGFGLHYARTLKEWRERFIAAWPEIIEYGGGEYGGGEYGGGEYVGGQGFHGGGQGLYGRGQGFDMRFRRMWELYLAYCEGGFRGGAIDVKQMLLVRD